MQLNPTVGLKSIKYNAVATIQLTLYPLLKRSAPPFSARSRNEAICAQVRSALPAGAPAISAATAVRRTILYGPFYRFTRKVDGMTVTETFFHAGHFACVRMSSSSSHTQSIRCSMACHRQSTKTSYAEPVSKASGVG